MFKFSEQFIRNIALVGSIVATNTVLVLSKIISLYHVDGFLLVLVSAASLIACRVYFVDFKQVMQKLTLVDHVLILIAIQFILTGTQSLWLPHIWEVVHSFLFSFIFVGILNKAMLNAVNLD